MRGVVGLGWTLLLMGISLQAQQALVRAKVLAVAEGRAEQVRKELPELLAAYPNDPGVLFLSAIVERDAQKAMEVYRRIVRDFPQSEWADDAQWRIVQYHALLRDTTKARAELAQFQRRYPLSEYLVHATSLVRTTVGLDSASKTTLSSASQPIAGAPERYGLQVGAYSTREAAEQEATKYRQQHLRVDIFQKAPTLFAVVIGDYSSRAAAEKARPLVEQQCNCTPFIIVKPQSSLQKTSPPAPKR